MGLWEARGGRQERGSGAAPTVTGAQRLLQGGPVVDAGLWCSLAPRQHLCLEGGVGLGVTGDRGCRGPARPQQAALPTTVRSQTELAFDTEPHSSTGFLGASVVRNPPANAGGVSLIPGSGRSPWRKKWQPTPVFLPGKSCG